MGNSVKEILDRGNRGVSALRALDSFGDAKLLKKYEDKIWKKLSNSSNARWDLAIVIALLARSGAWSAFRKETHKFYEDWGKDNSGNKCSANPYSPIGGLWVGTNSIYFFTFLKEKFGLGRTTVYTYLEVVDTFATYIDDEGKKPEYRINAEAQGYQFWQLIEMTSLTYQERLKVQPNWTREEIRAYKRALRDEKKGKIQPAEQVESEEKPLTEAQQRFAKYSKDDLIKLVVDLEDACEKNKLEVERILSCRPSISDVLPLKGELSAIIEKLLKSYNYEIHLNGRKQGAKAFAGVLSKCILKDCNNNDAPPSDAILDGDIIQEQFAV